MDIEGIRNEAQQILEFLEITMSDNPQKVIERGNVLQVYMARTGKLLADAKYILNDQKRHETMDIIRDFIIDQKLSAKVQNALIDGLCKEEQYLVDWCDRLNRTATHQLEWCRTVISKAKAEMALAPQSYNNPKF